MSGETDELLKRIDLLEQRVSALTSAMTYSYIAFLSIPLEIRRKDPDFAKSENEIKAALDKIYSFRLGESE